MGVHVCLGLVCTQSVHASGRRADGVLPAASRRPSRRERLRPWFARRRAVVKRSTCRTIIHVRQSVMQCISLTSPPASPACASCRQAFPSGLDCGVQSVDVLPRFQPSSHLHETTIAAPHPLPQPPREPGGSLALPVAFQRLRALTGVPCAATSPTCPCVPAHPPVRLHDERCRAIIRCSSMYCTGTRSSPRLHEPQLWRRKHGSRRRSASIGLPGFVLAAL